MTVRELTIEKESQNRRRHPFSDPWTLNQMIQGAIETGDLSDIMQSGTGLELDLKTPHAPMVDKYSLLAIGSSNAPDIHLSTSTGTTLRAEDKEFILNWILLQIQNALTTNDYDSLQNYDFPAESPNPNTEQLPKETNPEDLSDKMRAYTIAQEEWHRKLIGQDNSLPWMKGPDGTSALIPASLIAFHIAKSTKKEVTHFLSKDLHGSASSKSIDGRHNTNTPPASTGEIKKGETMKFARGVESKVEELDYLKNDGINLEDPQRSFLTQSELDEQMLLNVKETLKEGNVVTLQVALPTKIGTTSGSIEAIQALAKSIQEDEKKLGDNPANRLIIVLDCAQGRQNTKHKNQRKMFPGVHQIPDDGAHEGPHIFGDTIVPVMIFGEGNKPSTKGKNTTFESPTDITEEETTAWDIVNSMKLCIYTNPETIITIIQETLKNTPIEKQSQIITDIVSLFQKQFMQIPIHLGQPFGLKHQETDIGIPRINIGISQVIRHFKHILENPGGANLNTSPVVEEFKMAVLKLRAILEQEV